MQGPEVVILLMVAAAAGIIISSLSFRYKRQELRHKERMTALEKGAQLPEEPPENTSVPWSPRVYLLRGLVWLFSGIGLGIFLLGLSVSIGNRPQTYEDRLWRANQLRREGVPEEQLKEFLNSKEPVKREFPEGVSLIGLIPIGVGLAYIIYYRGEERRPA
jgi:uncharacterized protein DUF6249